MITVGAGLYLYIYIPHAADTTIKIMIITV